MNWKKKGNADIEEISMKRRLNVNEMSVKLC